MIEWLHRYIFRGIGLLLLISMVTGLLVAVWSVHNGARRVSAPVKTHK